MAVSLGDKIRNEGCVTPGFVDTELGHTALSVEEIL